MKLLLYCVILLVAFTLGLICGSEVSKSVVESKVRLNDGTEKVWIQDVEVTAYSPDPRQTQGDPFQMASGKFASPQDLEQLRYVALSRDLIDRYKIKYGDVIFIGFEVQDKMGPHIQNTVDIFMRNRNLALKFGRQKRKVVFKIENQNNVIQE